MKLRRFLLAGVALGGACTPAETPPPASVAAAIEPTPAAASRKAEALASRYPAVGACLADLDAGDRVAACDARDLDACFELIPRFEEGSSCPRTLWAPLCQLGHAASCDALGSAVVDTDRSQAEELWQRACEAGFPRACTNLGESVGMAGPETDEALRWLERGCELGDGEGCAAAGRRHLHGLGAKRDLKAGVARLAQSCELGHGQGCVELASAYASGRGVGRDVGQALQLYAKACAMDRDPSAGMACLMWAMQESHQRGVRVQRATGNVRAALVRACELGQQQTCGLIAVTLYGEAKYEEAIRIASLGPDDHWQTHYARGMSRFDLGRHRQALDDFERLVKLRPDWAYSHFWLWQTRTRLGTDGDADLEAALPGMPDAWPRPVADFFLGRTSEAKLLRLARHDDARTQLEQQCEAYYYVAQVHLAAGRVKRAKTYLKKTVDTGIDEFIEHAGAEAELARLAAP